MRRVFAFIVSIACPLLSFGQGCINFVNTVQASTWIGTNSVAGGPSTGLISGAGNYYFALFVAPSTITASPTQDPTLSGFTFTGHYATNTTTPGRLNGNPTTDDVAIAGYPMLSQASFIVAGWSANLTPYGPNWSQVQAWLNGGANAQAAWFGVSGVASVMLGGGPVPAGRIFGTNPGQVLGFTLGLQVPEPPSLSMLGLGLIASLAIRAQLGARRFRPGAVRPLLPPAYEPLQGAMSWLQSGPARAGQGTGPHRCEGRPDTSPPGTQQSSKSRSPAQPGQVSQRDHRNLRTLPAVNHLFSRRAGASLSGY